ncbi:MAG: lamin tail domain-containing protein [Clostridia bacterium]|nr:lamin tail domain-containing protein [Clostridia bacterium]
MAQQPARKAPAGKKAAHKKPVKKTTGNRDIILIAAIGLVVIIAAFLWQSFNTEGFNLTDKTADESAAVTEIYGVDVVRINEVMSANDSAWYTESGETADWFELINTSDKTIDLNGYVVAKSVDDTDRFVFPETILGPGEAVVVFCDNTVHNTAGYEYHAPFALSRAGATLMLFNPHGTAVDSVNIPDLENNISYARIDASAWERSAEYTPGLANTPENHKAFTDVLIDSPIMVTEIMARNATYAPDASGLCHDYVEIYNSSAETVDISGYHLSDSRDDVMKWAFPEGTAIAPGQYMIVYAYGVAADGLYADFKLSSEGETVVLSNEKGQLIQTAEYGLSATDQAWSLDADGKFKNTLPPTPGMANTADSAALISDRFAAQNGIGVFVTEIMASTAEAKYDWVELYNATSSPVDISGYGFSDDTGTPRKWLFPQGTVIQPGDYLGVYAAGVTVEGENFPTADFALSAAGGYHVCLATPEGMVFDRVYVPMQYAEISYGRKDGEYGRCYYFTDATPLTPNSGACYARKANEARFSVMGGLFDVGEVITVELTADPGDLIFYTTDCTEPTRNSNIYTGPITISSNTILRTRVFSDNALESYMNCQSYLFGIDHTVRVVSLVSDPHGLFSDEAGILVKGPNALPDYPYGGNGYGANFWMDWEREAHIEMFDVDGSTMITQECGIKLHGQYSRAEDQKAFKVYARNKYSGENTFQAAIFGDRPYTEYSSFLLRNSGQDCDKTRFRDSILTALATGTGVYYQETELCVVYLNGEYYGHYNLREHVNAESICQLEGWVGQEDDIDLVKANVNLFQGSDESFQNLLAWVKENDTSTEAAYEKIASVIDIRNYISYMSVQIWTGNTDTLNVKRYRNPLDDGTWKWVLYDLDWAFVTDTDSINRWLTPGGMGASRRTDNTLFIACMKNPRFRQEFLEYFGNQMATVLTTRTIYDEAMARYEALKPEMEMHSAKWGPSISKWESEIKEFLKYGLARPAKLLDYFKNSENLKLTDEEYELYFIGAEQAIADFETYYKSITGN